MNIEGCAHFLQEKEPTALLAIIGAWIEKDGLGWVKINTSQDNTNAKITLSDKQVSLRLSFETALELASLLLCLVRQNSAFRTSNSIPEVEKRVFEDFEILNNNGLFDVIIKRTDGEVLIVEIDEQYELDIIDDIAQSLALALFDTLGQHTASVAEKMELDNQP